MLKFPIKTIGLFTKDFYGLLGIVVTGCETVWGGKPPGCPSPTDPAIDEVAELVEGA